MGSGEGSGPTDLGHLQRDLEHCVTWLRLLSCTLPRSNSIQGGNGGHINRTTVPLLFFKAKLCGIEHLPYGINANASVPKAKVAKAYWKSHGVGIKDI
eukprot:6079987-Amphidinium_carterae.1